MAHQFLCDGTKYHLAGPHNDIIGLPLTITGVPEHVSVVGVELLRRPTFHVSLVCLGKIVERHPELPPTFGADTLKHFCKFISHTPIDFVEFTGEYRTVEDEDKKTLVAMCEVSGLREFFMELDEKYETHIEYPPTHVTLCTLGGTAGIFLTTADDIQKLTKPVGNHFGFELGVQ